MKFWPFNKKSKVEHIDPSNVSYTQVDVTEHFEQHLALSMNEWITTIAINKLIGHNNNGNLPDIDANDHEIYRIALSLSEIREKFKIHGDGVYCPVCHIANINIANLGEECPKCSRPLLAFGWS